MKKILLILLIIAGCTEENNTPKPEILLGKWEFESLEISDHRDTYTFILGDDPYKCPYRFIQALVVFNVTFFENEANVYIMDIYNLNTIYPYQYMWYLKEYNLVLVGYSGDKVSTTVVSLSSDMLVLRFDDIVYQPIVKLKRI